MKFRPLTIAIIGLCVSVVGAQDACPTLVQTALGAADEICKDIGRNQVCYGNRQIVAEASEDTIELVFSHVGDVENVLNIGQMQLSPLNTESDEWGIAVMKVQADLPDTLPGQNVMFVLFGDVTMDTVTNVEMSVRVIADATVNIRGEASTRAQVVGQASPEELLVATGRNELGDWIQVRFGEEDAVGWMASFLIEMEGDMSLLPIVGANQTPTQTQAFYFQTGIGDAGCAESPESGILVQTPEGVGEIHLTLNGADITLGSTAYIQANETSGLATYVLEGQAQIASFGLEQVVPEGFVLSLPIDADYRPKEQGWKLEGYNSDDLQTLPISLLDRQIEIAGAGDISYYNLWGCDVLFGPTTIVEGSLVYVSSGVGGYSSPEALEADLAERQGIITIDGVQFPFIRSDPPSINPADNLYSKNEFSGWVATSGVHTLTSDYSHATETPYSVRLSCTIDVP